MKWVKILAIVLISLVTVGAHAQAQYGGGSGEPDDPFLIYTAQQMNNIGANPDDWHKHFKLMADIDLSGFTGTDFNIIGYLNFNDSKSFTGVFDGNDHTISNFSYSSEAPDAAGLFGYGVGIEIKNLGLIDPNVEAVEAAKVGSLIGQMDVGVITNCYVQNGNVSGFGYVGGLVGSTYIPAIADCNVSATVCGWDKVGGLAGDNFGGTIVNCRSVSTVLGIWRIGGLVGTNDFTTILGMFFPGIIAECCSDGITEGLYRVGGLVGENYCLVTNCYTAAKTAGLERVGGLVGYNYLWPGVSDPPRVSYCYSVGSVSGDINVGGLVGSNEGGMVVNSFWDHQTSGLSNSSGGVGKSTSQMQRRSSFTNAGWDFVDETTNGTEDIWWILVGQDYPRLSWELIEDDPNDEPNNIAGPLSESMDTDLIFETGGDEDWFEQTDTFYYDYDAAQSGPITDDQESWLQTTVDGAGTLRFYWKVSSEGSCDYLEFYIDGVRQDRISDSEHWHEMTFEITGSSSHTLEWRYFKDGSVSEGDDCGWIDQVEWTPAPLDDAGGEPDGTVISVSTNTEDFETGDFTSLPWEHSGDEPWKVTSDQAYTGTDSAQAGTIGDRESSTLRITLDCVTGDISFYYKVSSEEYYDYLRFYIDGTQCGEWSGDEDWTQFSFHVNAGRRTFEWTYSKDSFSSSGDDTCWIDDITFPISN